MKKSILSVLAVSIVVAGTVFSLPAQAYKQSDVDKFMKSGECPNCDLSGYNMNRCPSIVNLSRANLKGANLKGANLFSPGLMCKYEFGDLSGATWTNGKKCAQGSIGVCK